MSRPNLNIHTGPLITHFQAIRTTALHFAVGVFVYLGMLRTEHVNEEISGILNRCARYLTLCGGTCRSTSE